MFEPPVLTAGNLGWQTAAHGPEPEAILMAPARVNGVPLVLHAFRIPMPYASGWTDRIAWEDDKGMLGTGVLWRMALAREHVRAIDSGASSMLLDRGSLEEDELEWEGRWLMLSRLLGCGGGGWMPATIGKGRYHIVGTPVLDRGQSDGPSWTVRPSDIRGGGDPGMPSIGMRLEGGACDLRLLRVRAIGGRMRGFSPDLHLRMGDALPVIGILGGNPMPMPMGDGQWLPLLVPSQLDDWSLDEGKMLDELGRDLPPGQARWFLSMCSKRFDAFDARVMEGLADACRMGDLALKDGRIWTSRSMVDMLGRLAFGRSDEDTRSRVFQVMSKTIVRGVRSDRHGTTHLIRARLAERVYLFDDSMLAQIGEEFACLASQCSGGEFLKLPWRAHVLQGSLPEAGSMPEWAGTLPALLDKRVDNFLCSWEG